jgi:hypothetical protein
VLSIGFVFGLLFSLIVFDLAEADKFCYLECDEKRKAIAYLQTR